ncbi:MAG: peptidoglycan-binding protein [Eubacteriales bacterium]|nr:peptidoglycan-binding protein [Eubacteriales bacterium]
MRFTQRGGMHGWFLRLSQKLRRREPAALVGCGVALLLLIAVPALLIASGGKADKPVEPALLRLEEELVDGVVDLSLPKPPPTPAPEPTPKQFARDVEDKEVSAIQMRLMELSYMDYDEPTELYGPYTEDAVMRFERTNGLPVDGLLTMSEYALLMSDKAAPYQVMLGVSGTDIKELQTRLIDLGYLEEGNVTGYFGDVTEQAVQKFQSRNHLSVDGMVGESTYEALYSEEAVAQALTYGEKSEAVQKIQERLERLGYLMTEPDGNFGKDTVTAVKLFQSKNGLIADGYVGPSTKAALFSSGAQPNALTIGDAGDSVSRIQKKLVSLGYLKKTTGYYGSDTEYAVKAFQKRNGLTGDGKAGRKTIAAINSDDPHGPSSSYKLPGTSGSSSGSGSTSGSSSAGGSGSSSNSGGSTTGSLDTLISVALSKKGSRYVTGAKGPNTFDCSGFVYWCLNQAGVKQGYMTSKNWRSVSKYNKISSMKDIRKGDIMVFRMSSSKGHVSIALDNSSMVHAGSTKGCVYSSSFRTDYWERYFYCAYRIF